MKANSLSYAVGALALAASAAATLGTDRPAAGPDRAGASADTAGQQPHKPEIAPPRSIYDQAFDKAVDKAKNGWLEDPLRHLEGDMSHVVGELTAFKTDKPVQQRQDTVTGRLDTLIKMLEKECSGSGGGGANPSKPLGRSILAKGPGGQGAMHDPKAGDKQWASLPPKQREQILQSRTEGFPAGFESLLQSYYQRLAQEQVEDGSASPGGEGGEGARPADAAPAAGDAPATGETPAAAEDGGAQ